jgi:hypothetical protein
VTPGPHALPTGWQALLVLAFGAATTGSIVFFAPGGLGDADLLLLAVSLGALATAALWLWAVALRSQSRWGLALALLLWVPYVNFVAASMFARRYWDRGARAPALLALAGMVGQTVVTLHAFLPSFMAPV